MTVKSLIEQLEKIDDPNAIVRIGGQTGYEALFLLHRRFAIRSSSSNYVWLETEMDFDIKAELEDFYDSCFYSTNVCKTTPYEVRRYMYRTGISYDLFKKYLGEEKANKIMDYISTREE